MSEPLTDAELRRFDDFFEIVAVVEDMRRLQVCGTCRDWDTDGHCYTDPDGGVPETKRHDPCHFKPSRWTAYWEAP